MRCMYVYVCDSLLSETAACIGCSYCGEGVFCAGRASLFFVHVSGNVLGIHMAPCHRMKICVTILCKSRLLAWCIVVVASVSSRRLFYLQLLCASTCCYRHR